jgi:hypothetical protein
MNLTDLFAKMKRYNENANVIFDDEEPIGRATDLVMPRKRWFRRRGSLDCSEGKISPPVHSTPASKR